MKKNELIINILLNLMYMAVGTIVAVFFMLLSGYRLVKKGED